MKRIRLRRAMASAGIMGSAVGLLLGSVTTAHAGNGYTQTNLNSSVAGKAPHTDPDLLNPWGLVAGPSTPFWVSDNHSAKSTVYKGDGSQLPLVVAIPGASSCSATTAGNPTGIVFNGSTDFVVTSGQNSGPARFIFDNEDGSISGWNPTADATHALRQFDDCSGGAEFKGLAFGSTGAGNFIYGTDFRQNATGNGKVRKFDGTWTEDVAGGFADATLPAGYHPFGIQNIGGNLYVTFALNNGSGDDSAGAGHGYVDVFTLSGVKVSNLVSQGKLNSPWGLALAPANFGDFSNDLLVGNFGDGTINAFDPGTGAFVGTLSDATGKPIVNPGLWALQFGNGTQGTSTNTLYLSAGINGEADGLFAAIAPAAAPAASPSPVPALPRAGDAGSAGSVPAAGLWLVPLAVLVLLVAVGLARGGRRTL
jgi:uncharacterized protein (TIGR03118 family)